MTCLLKLGPSFIFSNSFSIYIVNDERISFSPTLHWGLPQTSFMHVKCDLHVNSNRLCGFHFPKINPCYQSKSQRFYFSRSNLRDILQPLLTTWYDKNQQILSLLCFLRAICTIMIMCSLGNWFLSQQEVSLPLHTACRWQRHTQSEGGMEKERYVICICKVLQKPSKNDEPDACVLLW